MSGDSTTKRMIKAYTSQSPPTLFLFGLFRSPKENFYTSETVEVNIRRNNEKVSVAMTSVEENYCNHTFNKYKNIEYTPPVHKEAMPFHAFNLMKRAIGDNPYKGSNIE